MSDCGCEPDVPPEVTVTDPLIDPDVTNPLPETEPFLIPLCLTRDQYQAIIDSLHYSQGLLSDNGCYNERNALELLMKHLPYANKPLEIPCVNACDIISECIEENPGTQAALNTYMTELVTTNTSFMQTLLQQIYQQSLSGEPLTEEQFSDPEEGNLLPDEVTSECDPDKLFGAAGGIVDYINDAITDVFEALEQASNTIEYAAIAAQLAPAIGSTASSAIEFADQVQETLAEAYAGEFTVEVRDQLACDIFCRALANDCHITLETLNEMLLERLATIDFDDFAEFVLYFSTGAFEGTQVVEVAFMLVVQALRYGQQFAGILGLSPLAVIAKRAASRDPDPAWEELCDCVGTAYDWEEITDAVTGENVEKWSILGGVWGTYEAGLYFDSSTIDLGELVYRALVLTRTVEPETILNYIRVDGTYSPGVLHDTNDQTWYFEWGTYSDNIQEPASPTLPRTLTGLSEAGDDVFLQLIAGVQPGDTDPGGIARITKITLRGDGDPPA